MSGLLQEICPQSPSHTMIWAIKITSNIELTYTVVHIGDELVFLSTKYIKHLYTYIYILVFQLLFDQLNRSMLDISTYIFFLIPQPFEVKLVFIRWLVQVTGDSNPLF